MLKSKAQELYDEKEYNGCLEELYGTSSKARAWVWGLIILSFVLSGTSIVLSYFAVQNESVILIVAAVAAVAAAAFTAVTFTAVTFTVVAVVASGVAAVAVALVAAGDGAVALVAAGAGAGAVAVALVAAGAGAVAGVASEKYFLPILCKHLLEEKVKR